MTVSAALSRRSMPGPALAILVLCLALLEPFSAAAEPPTPGDAAATSRPAPARLLSCAAPRDRAQIAQAAACCKICRKGKACGDSCIKRSYSCTKPRGCACDGQ